MFSKFKILVLFVVLFTRAIVAGEVAQNVVFLKNGSVINCIIIEQVPNEFIKIRTIDGSLLIFRMDEVDKIASFNNSNSAPENFKLVPSSKNVISTLTGGLSIPIGDFAKTSGNNAAYARIGYAIGLVSASVDNNGMLFGLSSNIVVNSVDVDNLRQEFGIPDYIDIDVDSYVNLDACFMLGVGSSSANSKSFIAGLAGASYCTLPQMNISDNYQTISQERNSKLALCYGATAGSSYSSGLSVVIKFLSMEPEFDVTVTTSDYEVSEKAKQRISYISIGFGISL